MLLRFPVVLLLMALLMFLCTPVFAADLSQKVAAEMKPVSGYIVMPAGEEFLIDLDALKGVQEGDVFSVVVPGEKVVHPVTKEVIGALDKVKGYLQVTRVKSGYSYARALPGSEGLGKGDQIRRFQNIGASFWDYTGEGEPLYLELRAALPSLEWKSYAQSQENRPAVPRASGDSHAGLIFIYNDNGLAVKDSTFQSVRFYPSAAKAQIVSPAASSVSAPMSPAASEPKKPAGILSSVIETLTPSSGSSAIIRNAATSTEGVWTGPAVEGSSVGLEVGDFDGDGLRELAFAFSDRIEISRLKGGEQVPVASISLGMDSPLAIDRADLNGDGRPELYVTVAQGLGLSSLVVEFVGDRYQVSIRNIPWFFRSLEIPGEGRVLLGQELGQKENYGGRLFRITRSGNQLVAGASLEVPRFVVVHGFLPFGAAGVGTAYANLAVNNKLQVRQLGETVLWESAEEFGGSLVSMERRDFADIRGNETRFFYPKLRLEAGPEGLVLAPRNWSDSMMDVVRKYSKGQVIALKWDGTVMREVWRTKPLDGALVDFRLADVDNDGADEMVMAVSYTQGGWARKARSGLVVFEMQ